MNWCQSDLCGKVFKDPTLSVPQAAKPEKCEHGLDVRSCGFCCHKVGLDASPSSSTERDELVGLRAEIDHVVWTVLINWLPEGSWAEAYAAYNEQVDLNIPRLRRALAQEESSV
jgi:hypothetical protein